MWERAGARPVGAESPCLNACGKLLISEGCKVAGTVASLKTFKPGLGTARWGLRRASEGLAPKHPSALTGRRRLFSQDTWYWQGTPGAADVVMSGVRCSGPELALQQCQKHGPVHCSHGSGRFAAGVSCTDSE